MRKILFASIATLALAAPAFAADPTDTVKEVIAKGVIMSVAGMEIDMAYNPDGTFIGMGGQFGGKYRVDGNKICISADQLPAEQCLEYPDGKKSGDKFTLNLGDFGPADITIR